MRNLTKAKGLPQATNYLRSLSCVLGIVVVCFGLIGVFGWGLRLRSLGGITFNPPALQANVALCLTLTGTALISWYQEKASRKKATQKTLKIITFSCAFLLVLIAGLTLVNDRFNLDLGIDYLGQYFRQPSPNFNGVTPDRIPVTITICFLLAGFALSYLNPRSPQIIRLQVLAFAIWLLSFWELLTHVYGVIYYFPAGLPEGGDIYAAIALQLLSVGILCTYPKRGLMRLLTGQQAGSVMTRQLLPIAIMLPPIVGSLCALGYRAHLYPPAIETALTNTLNVFLFTGLLSWNAYQLNRMNTRWKTAETALQQMNHDLEQRVQERTIALQWAADELETRVAERTSDLQAIIDRWQLEFLLRGRATQLRQESEQRFRAIFDTTFQFVGLLTTDGILLEANQTALNFGGLQLADVINRPFWEARWWTISPETQEQLKQAIIQAAAGEFVRYEVEVKGAGDTTAIIDFSLKPMFDQAGNVKLLIPEGRDISDRKQMEKQLALQSTIVNTMAEGVCLIRATDNRIIYANPKFERMFGYAIGELENQPISVVNYANSPAVAAQIAIDITEQIKQKGEATYEVHNIRKDGTLFWSRANASVFDHPEHGTIFITVQADITSQKQAEIALRESENKYQTLFNILPIGISITDDEGQLIEANPASERILGLTRSEHNQRTYDAPDWQIIRPDQSVMPPAEYASVRALKENRFIENIEKGVLRPDGTICWLSVSAAPVPLENYGVVIAYVDITERKQVEADLRLSEERLQLALEASREGLWDWYVATGAVYLDDRYQEMLGYQPGELDTANLTDWERWVHPDDLEWVTEILQAHLKDSAVPYAFEYRVQTKSGEWKWIADYGKVVSRDAAGNPTRMIGTHRDISDRKLAEQALQASEERYRAIVEDQTELICRFLPDGTILFVNEAYCRYFGVNSADLIGKTYQPVVYEDDQAYVNQMVQCMTKDNPTVIIENRVVIGEDIRWTQWSNRRISDTQGNLIEYQSVGRDITDRKVVELELQRAKEAAEAASQAKSMFLANMSHELRTPLNVILGFTQLLQRDSLLLPEQQENIKIIHRSGEHLLNLINDILDLSKIEAGRLTVDNDSVDLFALLRSLRNMLFYRAESKGLQFTFTIAPDVPQYIVTDAQKLRQILINLLSNAIKFTDEGRVTLSVSMGESRQARAWRRITSTHPSMHPASPASPPSTTLHFEVEDTGIGIAENEIDSVFDAFVQSRSTQRMPEGTGLGLTITLRFVEVMGGDLSVYSALSQGSLFKFELPVQLPEAPLPPQIETQRQIVKLAPGQPTYRVLIVDDQLDNRLLLVRLMSQLGFEFREATNGKDAVNIWQQWHPHLILMDIRMPEMNGDEAIQLIQADPERSQTKIIALTAYASSGDRTLALAAGADDYLAKPFQAEELLTKIATHLGLQYEYAENVLSSQSQSDSEERLKRAQLTPDSLTVMPLAWIIAFHQAALNCDDEAAINLITQIPSNHTSLTLPLTRLVRNYQFHQILQLTQPHFRNSPNN